MKKEWLNENICNSWELIDLCNRPTAANIPKRQTSKQSHTSQLEGCHHDIILKINKDPGAGSGSHERPIYKRYRVKDACTCYSGVQQHSVDTPHSKGHTHLSRWITRRVTSCVAWLPPWPHNSWWCSINDCWRVAEHTTPTYATLVYGLFWAEGN